jgi:hypothetical protein
VDGVYILRCGDGLVPVGHGEADVAVVAGMGGETILNILDADPEKTASIGIYVLQPRTKPDVLRRYLRDNKYHIVDEDLAEENGRICEIIVMSPHRSHARTSNEQWSETGSTIDGSASGESYGRESARNIRPPSASNTAKSDGTDAPKYAVLPEAEQIGVLKAKRHVLLGRFIEAKIAVERRIADEAAKGCGVAAMRRTQLATERIEVLSRLLNG